MIARLLHLPGAAAAVFVLILSVTLPSSLTHARAVSARCCVASECEALISFKKSYIDPNGLLSSWRGEDCCGWKGVRCDNRTGHVIKLDLDLSGFESRGQIMNSTIIASLPHLRYLDLSLNDFNYTTSEPLSFLGALHNLRYLSLVDVYFPGSIPSQLGNLSSLQNLYLGNFYVQYVSDLAWLPHLSSLESLGLSLLNLSSASDWVSKVNMLSNLKNLYLCSCSLNSTISPLSQYSNLTHLEILDLSENPFNSFLQHSWFWDVTSIKELYLNDCVWSGPIPDALGNMSSLEVLHIERNSISGIVPTTLENICNLQILNMEQNSINADMIGKLPQCSWSKLRELHLHGAHLTGQLPIWIGNLSSLSYLDLSWNVLVGSIPSGIGNMRSLGYLDLSHNMLGGSIPSGIGNMRNLGHLRLSANMLVGSIPSGIGTMRSLNFLDLSHNMLGGSIPSGIGNMRNLSHLHLSHNMLIGSMPFGIRNMRTLSYLDLSHNMLDGDVPSGIGALGNLTHLILCSNNFSSVLSKEHFASLVNLKNLDIENTSLKLDFGKDWVPSFRVLKHGYFGSCDMGPQFPSWLKWQTAIQELDISNTKINDVLPHWFWAAFPSASILNLSGNKLSGTLPPKLVLPLVLSMDLSGNSFSGQLPANLKAPYLGSLDLYNNQFTGAIPPYICNTFHEINLSNNQLTGGFPHCQNNTLSSLSMLDLRNNNLSGEFPHFLQYAASLSFLDLSYNRFSGSVPIWVAEKMPSLEVLILRSNMFHGHLPRQLSRIVGLHYLDVAHNNLSGIIPSSLARLRAMADPFERDRHENYSTDSISTFIKNRELNYTHEFTKYTVLIDLSSNGLIGQIPKELTLLKGLRSLNLSKNQLSGLIPDDIGSLKKLESLDLSYNYFSGKIPSGLSELTFLSCLNLSYNNLSGTIPSGQQLQTLNDQYMYIGNPGLCGPPLLKNCSMNVMNPTVSQQHEGGR